MLSLNAHAEVARGADPSDVYFQAYLEVRNAEKLSKDGDDVAALAHYRKAIELFNAIRKVYPNWKLAMVKNRTDLTISAMQATQAKAAKKLEKQSGSIAELEGGIRVGGNVPDGDRASRGTLEVDALRTRRLNAAEAEVKRLRELIAKNSETRNTKDRSRIDDLKRLNRSLQNRLKNAEEASARLRREIAAAPMRSQMRALDDQVNKLEQEKHAMSLALRSSRNEHAEALSKVEILSADLQILQQKSKNLSQENANLSRNLKTERQVSNRVVSGQKKQIAELQESLRLKGEELFAAQKEITQLKTALEQSYASYAELQQERDQLLIEKEQISALLELSETSRINKLVDQNMSLAKELREAKERVERLNIDGNAAKDDVIDALRDLAIAKSQINQLKQNKRAQDRRLAELAKRLQNESRSLDNKQVEASNEEISLLKNVIRRQIRVQKRRYQARQILIDAVQSIATKDEVVASAIDVFDEQEIQLSYREQQLIADTKVDGEFVSPFARDRTTVSRASKEMFKELDSFDRAAKRAYVAGRLLPARELFEMILEQHPGHVSALCKLGVVHLKLAAPVKAADQFQRAIELDRGNSYAHRMLGYTQLQMQNLGQAEELLSKAVKLDPSDAKSYLFLGTVLYQQGKLSEAESQFKGAINADPVASEPYYNLALLHAQKGNVADARNYYGDALKRGAVPNQKLEKHLWK